MLKYKLRKPEEMTGLTSYGYTIAGSGRYPIALEKITDQGSVFVDHRGFIDCSSSELVTDLVKDKLLIMGESDL